MARRPKPLHLLPSPSALNTACSLVVTARLSKHTTLSRAETTCGDCLAVSPKLKESLNAQEVHETLYEVDAALTQVPSANAVNELLSGEATLSDFLDCLQNVRDALLAARKLLQGGWGAQNAPRAFAFTAVVTKSGYTIGRAHENVDGYTAVPNEGTFSTWEAAKRRADEMNRLLGLEPKRAAAIVISSMRGQLEVPRG